MPLKPLFLLLAVLLLQIAFVKGQPAQRLQFSSVNAGIQLWAPSEFASLAKLKLLSKNEDDFTPLDLSEYHEGFVTINGKSNTGIPFILPNNKVSNAGALKTLRFFGQLGFIPYSKKREQYLVNRELLFGIYVQPYVYHNTGFINRDTILQDSIIGNYAYYTEWSPVVGLSADYVFKSDPSKRAGAYFGIGAAAGCSVHPVIMEEYGKFSQTILADTFSNGVFVKQYFESLEDNSQSIAACTSLLLELRFPFGGTLRIADDWTILANIEAKLSKQVYLNGTAFDTRLGIAGTLGLRFGF